MIDLTADEAVTDFVLTQQVAEESFTHSSPVAPPIYPSNASCLVSLLELLLSFKKKIIISLEDVIRSISVEESGSFSVDIRRSHVLSDVLKESKKRKFDPKK